MCGTDEHTGTLFSYLSPDVLMPPDHPLRAIWPLVNAADYWRCRRACRTRGTQPRIGRRGVESSQRLGCHRWVVERPHTWLYRMHRLRAL